MQRELPHHCFLGWKRYQNKIKVAIWQRDVSPNESKKFPYPAKYAAITKDHGMSVFLESLNEDSVASIRGIKIPKKQDVHEYRISVMRANGSVDLLHELNDPNYDVQ